MKQEITILQAMDDPKLFGPWFKGDSWAAWRVFLAALFGLPMSESQLESFRAHTGRTAAPTVQAREARLLCGRRAGKSLIAAFIATFLACFRDYQPFLAPGEMATVMNRGCRSQASKNHHSLHSRIPHRDFDVVESDCARDARGD